ncbi:MAG: hypothetical protein SFT90_03490 [Rickettsiales bacterium]|nr:hypothetical protein [Rickettsiales bacterium]
MGFWNWLTGPSDQLQHGDRIRQEQAKEDANRKAAQDEAAGKKFLANGLELFGKLFKELSKIREELAEIKKNQSTAKPSENKVSDTKNTTPSKTNKDSRGFIKFSSGLLILITGYFLLSKAAKQYFNIELPIFGNENPHSNNTDIPTNGSGEIYDPRRPNGNKHPEGKITADSTPEKAHSLQIICKLDDIHNSNTLNSILSMGDDAFNDVSKANETKKMLKFIFNNKYKFETSDGSFYEKTIMQMYKDNPNLGESLKPIIDIAIGNLSNLAIGEINKLNNFSSTLNNGKIGNVYDINLLIIDMYKTTHEHSLER